MQALSDFPTWLPDILVSSLAPCPLLSEVQGGGLVYGYGDDDLNRPVAGDDKVSEDEDSRESISVSI